MNAARTPRLISCAGTAPFARRPLLRRALSALALAALLGLASPVRAQTAAPAEQMKINLAWQIALDAAHFSPGVIDGKFGRKSDMALKEYAARFFPGARPFDKKVFDALAVDVEHAITSYTITAEDEALVGVLPEDWNEKARLTRLPYDSLQDCLAERFRCSENLLQSLNPGMSMAGLKAGQTIRVPNARPFTGPDELENPSSVPASARAAGGGGAEYIAIDLAEKTIRAFDRQDRQLALFHCSVAKDKAKLPARNTTVLRMATNPNYTFDPIHWPEVHNVDHVLTIPPGPRSPVGLVWLGLDLPGYGIHGTPKPEMIGKTGSHGCFRMTNWDAVRLYSLVHTGMTVKIVNPERDGAGADAH